MSGNVNIEVDTQHSLIVSCEHTLLTDERLDRATVEFPLHFCLSHVVALAVIALSHVAAIWTCDNSRLVIL